jgi:hypothetical protein
MTTLADAQATLAAYLKAETDILAGKEVRFSASGSDRLHRMEDLEQVRAGRQEWERKVAALQAGAARAPTIDGLGYSVADFSQGTWRA